MDSIRGVGMMDFSGIKELTIGGVKLKELYVDGVKLWQSGRLPAGYTELEYIETDGTSWIDTGVNASLYPDGIRYTIDFYTTKVLASDNHNYIFGALDGKSRSGNLSYFGTGEFRLIIGGSAAISRAYTGTAVGQRRYIEAFATSTADNSTMTVDGNDSRKASSFALAAMPNANVFLGFCSGISTTSSSKAFVGRLYSFTMAKADGTPIRDFVPAKYRDGTVGMFDMVTGIFFGNAGTGTLTAGGAIW